MRKKRDGEDKKFNELLDALNEATDSIDKQLDQKNFLELLTKLNEKHPLMYLPDLLKDYMKGETLVRMINKHHLIEYNKINNIFEIVMNIRSLNNEIPIILMGYYNSIFNLGIDNFTAKCAETGVDGLIIVDLQPEEDSELFTKSKERGIDLIRLITPTTDQKRLTTILSNASGFLYYVTITGITGQNSANIEDLKQSINTIKSSTKLPIVAGFGIKNKNDVEQISTFTDGVVVGSSIVNIIKDNLNDKNKMINEIKVFTKDLKEGIKE